MVAMRDQIVTRLREYIYISDYCLVAVVQTRLRCTTSVRKYFSRVIRDGKFRKTSFIGDRRVVSFVLVSKIKNN